MIEEITTQECYYRKNLGLNGVVDARQCGVHGDGTLAHQDAILLQTCLGLAKANNIPTVSTGGGQIRDDKGNGDGTFGQDLLVPGGITLTCGGTAVGLVKNNDYTGIQHAIILDGGHTIRPRIPSDPGGDDGSSAKLDGCLVLRADDGLANQYAPNSFVPTTLRESLLEVAHFAGTAISAVSESFAVTNTTVLGFAQCWKGSGARLLVRISKCDATAGFWVDQSGGGVSLDDTQIRPFLTGQGGCANCSGFMWTAASLVQHGTAYRITIDKNALPGSYPQNGDTVWVSTPTNHVQSAAGRYENISGVTNTVSCPSGNCEFFDLPGSVFSSPTVNISATSSFLASSIVLTALNIDIRKLAVGMNVGPPAGGGCVPTSKIVDINPAWNTVWISKMTTCPGTNATVLFWDDADTSTSSATLTLTATERTGDAYKVTNTGGVTFSNCRQLNHYVGFHVGNNANLTRFSNCANDSDMPLQDDAVIGLLCDGMHQGNDCSDTDWVNGVLGQHATGSIVLESDSTHALHVSNAGLGPASGRQSGRYADVEAGVLLLDNSSAGTGVGGNIFVADGTHLVTLATAGSGYKIGDVLTENGGTNCSIHAQITIDSVNSGVPATWHQSRQGVCTTWPGNPWATICSGCGGGITSATGSAEITTARFAMSNVVASKGNLYLQDTNALFTGCGNVLATPSPCKSEPQSP